MSISVSSSTDALSTLQSLLQSVANTAGNVAGIGPVGDFLADAAKSTAPTSGQTTSARPFGMTSHPLPPEAMAALIALKSKDGSGSGTGAGGGINQSDFEAALSPSGVDPSGADALFAELDRNGDGTIDRGELTSATRRGHGRHHHHGDANADGASAAQTTAQANPTLMDQLMKIQAQLAGEQAATISAVA